MPGQEAVAYGMTFWIIGWTAGVVAIVLASLANRTKGVMIAGIVAILANVGMAAVLVWENGSGLGDHLSRQESWVLLLLTSPFLLGATGMLIAWLRRRPATHS